MSRQRAVQVTLHGVTHGTLTLSTKLGGEFQVTTTNDQQAPRVAVAGDGHMSFVWQAPTGTDIYAHLCRRRHTDQWRNRGGRKPR
jgi:hypothetical protein